MSVHLCISVTLLDDLFHGCRDGDEPEWPPSPMRLFQALLAGSRLACRNGEWNGEKAEAFRWLERQEPPTIITPEAQPASAYTLFVPNNDADAAGKFDRQSRLTSKIVQPQRVVGVDCTDIRLPTLYYLWKVDNSEEVSRHCAVLCQEARRLTALGWGIDQAFAEGRILTGAEVATLAGVRWQPRKGGRQMGRMLRVPKQGSLADCERAYKAFTERIRRERVGRRTQLSYAPADRVRCFDVVAYERATRLPPRPYAAFELPDGVAFQPENVRDVAAMLRSLACREKEDFCEQFPDDNSEVYLAGHVNGAATTPPRFSYLPLPSIGHEHADGMIRRVLIAEPFGGDGRHAAWAQRRLLGQPLIDDNGNQRGVLMNLWRNSSRGIVRLYTQPATTWATVTPVILPGHDDHKPEKARKLIEKALRQSGIDQPCEFEWSAFSRFPKSLSAHKYDRNGRLTGYVRPNHLLSQTAVHMTLRFKDGLKMPGPIAIGAGRHCGFGLFAAAESL